MCTERSQNNEAGFSILELMASAGLLFIVLESTIGGMVQSSSFINHQKLLNGGVRVSQAVLEGLLLASSTDSILSPGIHNAQFDVDARQVPVNGQYKAKWTVTKNNPFPSINRVQVEVSWQESNQVRNVVLTTFRN